MPDEEMDGEFRPSQTRSINDGRRFANVSLTTKRPRLGRGRAVRDQPGCDGGAGPLECPESHVAALLTTLFREESREMNTRIKRRRVSHVRHVWRVRHSYRRPVTMRA